MPTFAAVDRPLLPSLADETPWVCVLLEAVVVGLSPGEINVIETFGRIEDQVEFCRLEDPEVLTKAGEAVGEEEVVLYYLELVCTVNSDTCVVG